MGKALWACLLAGWLADEPTLHDKTRNMGEGVFGPWIPTDWLTK